MVKKFAIVKYIEEQDALGIIPLKWASFDEKSCLYPPVKSDLRREKLIYTEAEPTKEWTASRIIVLHKYETYLSARQNLKKAEETSNLDTDDDDAFVSRMRKRKPLQFHDEYQEDDAGNQEPPGNARKIRVICSKTASTAINCSSVDDPNPNFHSEDLDIPIGPGPSSQPDETCFPGPSSYRIVHQPANNISQSHGNFPVPPSTTSSGLLKNMYSISGTSSPVRSSGSSRSSSLSDADRILLAQMQATMASIAEKLETLNRKVDRLLSSQDSSGTAGQNPEYHVILGLLPLQSLEDFNVLEDQIKADDNFRNHLVKIFASTGGRDARSCTMDIMKRLMIDSLAEEFSYSGKVRNNEPKKIGFSEKKLCRVVHAAVDKIFKEEATDDVVRSALCSWLQQAKSRRNRRDQRLQKKDA